MRRSSLTEPAAGPPSWTAWIAAGRPSAPGVVDPTGWCARCGGTDGCVDHRRIVSARFTDRDRWPFGGDLLCVKCAHCYAHKPYLRTDLTLTAHPAACRETDRSALAERLAAGALSAEVAVVVNVKARKHLLPLAEWGAVITDHHIRRWREDDARLLALMLALRGLPKVTARALDQPAPPMVVLRAVPRSRWATLISQWAELAAWRADPDWWVGAQAITAAHAHTQKAHR